MKTTINNFIFGNRYNWSDPFTIVIDTRNTKAGGSAANEFVFPQSPDANDNNIDFLVDWGDGQFSRVQNKSQAIVPHVYNLASIYTINFYKLKGVSNKSIPIRYETFQTETDKLLKILRWGVFSNSRSCFSNCKNLDMSEVEGVPRFNSNANGTFTNNITISTIKGLNNIIIEGTCQAFLDGCTNFNQDATLNIPNAAALSFFFRGCSKMNSQLVLNAPSATLFSGIFTNCTAFNTLPVFNAPNASDLINMFANCTSFNRDVSTMFDWSKIIQMSGFMQGKSSANYNAMYYDNLLIALDAGGQTNVPLGMGTIKYTSAGLTAKNNLIAKGWTITDGGIN